jgi:uncharacterized coiled-coil protein SlyX
MISQAEADGMGEAIKEYFEERIKALEARIQFVVERRIAELEVKHGLVAQTEDNSNQDAAEHGGNA